MASTAIPRATGPSSLLATLALLLPLAACSEVKGRGHNVLLVTLDTVRADYFGSYGHPEGLTPNFGSLAAAGVRFAR